MAVINTELKGITTSAVYEDGDMYDCVNLEKRTGVLKPTHISFVEEENNSTLNGDIVTSYQHNSGGSCNKRISLTSEGYLYAGTTQLATGVPTDATITSIGNVVIIGASDKIRYYLCTSGSYKEVKLDASVLSDLVELRVSLHERSGEIELLQFSTEDLISSERATDDAYMREVAKGLFAKARAKVSELGYLQDFHLAVTAVELFDGSVVMHSVPVLLGQAYDEKQRYSNLAIRVGIGDNPDDNHILSYKYSPVVTGYTVTPGNNQAQYSDYISYAGGYSNIYGCVNGGLTAMSGSTNMLGWMPFMCMYDSGNMQATTPAVHSYQNELQYRIRKSLSSDNAQLVKSINIYLSAPSSMYDINNTEDLIATGTFEIRPDDSIVHNVGISNIRPLIRDNKDIIEDLLQSDFYKVAEIQVTGALPASSTWKTLNIKDKIGDALYVQQTLPIDPGRHALKVNGGVYAYNNRLHLYNYSEILWNGIDRKATIHQAVGKGQFNYNANGGALSNAAGWLSVELKSNNDTSVIVVNYPTTTGNIPQAAVIGYPDRRATKMTVYLRSSAYMEIRTYTLVPSRTHNVAFAVSSELKTRIIPNSHSSETISPPTPHMQDIRNHNGIKVSEVSNPFYFHPRNSYQIGSSGTVLKVGLNKMNVSDRNFGSYPLYAQTENSWYSMQQGAGEVAYSSIIPVPGDIATNDNIIETPYGLIYIGAKGLYVLNNNKSELLTAHLQEPPMKLNIEVYNDMSEELKAMLNNTHNDFISYLQGLTSVIYDPIENTIILTNSTETFSYVFNLLTKHLHRTDLISKTPVENSLAIVGGKPTISLFEGKKIYTIERNRDGEEVTEIFFTTRPLIHQTTDIKRLDRAILSAIMYAKQATEITHLLYASNDAVNFKLMRGKSFTVPILAGVVGQPDENVGYKDLDTGHLAATKYRYFVYVFYATLAEKSEISLISSAVHKEYNNEKIR